MNHVRFHGAMRPHRAPKRIGGDDFEQTRPIRTRVIKKQQPIVDWGNPLESSAVVMLAIGLATWALCAWWPA